MVLYMQRRPNQRTYDHTGQYEDEILRRYGSLYPNDGDTQRNDAENGLRIMLVNPPFQKKSNKRSQRSHTTIEYDSQHNPFPHIIENKAILL